MVDRTTLRARFWLEAALSVSTAVLTVMTLISREWVEIIFGIDPDHGSGALEWAIVIGLALTTVLLSLLARGNGGRRPSNRRLDRGVPHGLLRLVGA
jgi:hypothetical protein